MHLKMYFYISRNKLDVMGIAGIPLIIGLFTEGKHWTLNNQEKIK